VIDRQRDTIIKAKKDYRFEYILFYKAISNRGKEKKYIKTLKYLNYIYLIYFNPFSFKVYKTRIIEY
jgi:adenine C2-methylase RlmN of 23S rRNA A2503 and tRNA A37